MRILLYFSKLGLQKCFLLRRFLTLPELTRHCKFLLRSACTQDLTTYFYNREYNANDRFWMEISESDFKKAVDQTASCQLLIDKTQKFPPKLTSCQADLKAFENVKIDVKTVFLPKCDAETGNYMQIQEFNNRAWCVNNVEKSSEPKMLFMKYHTIPKNSPDFCNNLLRSHICHGVDTIYCKNQICGLADKNMVYMPCSSDCVKGTCASQKNRCPRICYEGCFCKSGYILDENLGVCVQIDHCQLPCSESIKMKTPKGQDFREFQPTCGYDGKPTWVQKYAMTYSRGRKKGRTGTIFYCARNPTIFDLRILPMSQRPAKNLAEFTRFVNCEKLASNWLKRNSWFYSARGSKGKSTASIFWVELFL